MPLNYQQLPAPGPDGLSGPAAAKLGRGFVGSGGQRASRIRPYTHRLPDAGADHQFRLQGHGGARSGLEPVARADLAGKPQRRLGHAAAANGPCPPGTRAITFWRPERRISLSFTMPLPDTALAPDHGVSDLLRFASGPPNTAQYVFEPSSTRFGANSVSALLACPPGARRTNDAAQTYQDRQSNGGSGTG